MKPDIHPKYYEAKVHCGSCGTEWTVGSTRPELRVDVCANCHPFFTGKQTIIDTAGQVDCELEIACVGKILSCSFKEP